VDGDSGPLSSVARALDKIQAIYGVIPNIKSKGAASRKASYCERFLSSGRSLSIIPIRY
jgi:hypothetical protein